MAKNIHKSSGAPKLGIGYKVTLWVIGIILFLAFAFATFCAFGGLDLIMDNDYAYQLMVDENGEYYYYDEDGNKIMLSDMIVSGTDVSATDVVVSNTEIVDDAEPVVTE